MFCNGNKPDRQNHPVNCVDWVQAKKYCEAINKRLPKQAEWEYAARGTDGRTYPWGNGPPDEKKLNGCGGECLAMMRVVMIQPELKPLYPGNDGFEATAPVGSFPGGASPFGALDMGGNVTEWLEEPEGPYAKEGKGRSVSGGGSWAVNGTYNYSGAIHGWQYADERVPDYGFRCARAED